MQQYKSIILNLFDGEAGAGASADSTGNGSTATAIKPEVAARGKSLGLSDDMLEDYQKAFGGSDEGEEKTETTTQEATTEEDADKEFEDLISGKYRDSYQKKMSAAIKDRVTGINRERSDLQKRIDSSDRILKMLAGKYPDLDPNDPDALYNAVKSDGDIWRERAISTGGSIEDAVTAFEEGQRQSAEHEELERYRQNERARQLDLHFQELAAETVKKYPGFQLQEEFSNPRFRQALDFIAAENSERNKQTGRNDEIYDLTYAYELAHADELQKNVIERTSKATASAYAQTLAANRNRVTENASHNTAPAQPNVDLMKMSDEEFEQLKRDVLSGKRRIPG